MLMLELRSCSLGSINNILCIYNKKMVMWEEKKAFLCKFFWFFFTRQLMEEA